MSDDLISRKAVIEAVDRHTREDGTLDDDISIILEEVETAFDKEKVIKIISHVNSAIAVGDKNALYWMAKLEEIVEKGGIE